MKTFICKSESYKVKSLHLLDPPEWTCDYEEIEAENRNQAKWKFIKKFYKGNIKNCPRISVTQKRPYLVLEQDPENPTDIFLLDENMDPICSMKFESENHVAKLAESLILLNVPFEKITLPYFDTGTFEVFKEPKKEEVKIEVSREDFDAIKQSIDQLKVMLDAKNEELKAANLTISDLKAENDVLKSDLVQRDIEHASLNRKISDLKKSNADTVVFYANQASENRVLKEQKEALKETLNLNKKMLIENADLNTKIYELEQTIQKQGEAKSLLIDENKHLEEINNDLKDQISKMKLDQSIDWKSFLAGILSRD